MTGFDWPCDRRTAHGPHQELITRAEHGCDGTEESCVQNCPIPVPEVFDCPGVKAHPNTMIGRPSGTPS